MRQYRYILGLLILFIVLLGSLSAAAQDSGTQREEATGFQMRGATPQQSGEVRFVSGPNDGDALDIALDYIRRNRRTLGLTGDDINDVLVTDHYVSAHNGVTHIYLRQRHNGIEVFGADININVAADGSIINLGNSFVPKLSAAINAHNPGRAATQAVASAAQHLGLNLNRPLQVLSQQGGAERKVVLSDGGISRQEIPAKLVYQPVSPTEVRLAWLLEIEESDNANWWVMTVDAQTGDVLAQIDYVDHDTWGEPDSLYSGHSAARGTGVFGAVPWFQTDGAAYNVFALPKESPSDGPRTLEVDPAHPVASPYGWHDTDGAAGPEYTVTRGNNVHAYTDLDANNQPDAGSDPDGGSSLTFDFALDLTQGPDTYRPAAVTNLFYWNNIVHDVFYGYGFDEVSGNFQTNNYGRGGLGNDYVRAEAQDGSGNNNANFGTPSDGNRPRMQMYVWNYPFANQLTVNPPSPAAGDYIASRAAFGPDLADTGPITADATLSDDGAGASTTDACEPLVGFPAGNIAIADRGSCTFVLKARNAQVAGAAALIVVNNVSGDPITMGGSDPLVVIPSVMISLDDGTLLKGNLPFNATLSSLSAGIPDRDSDLDNGVIIHEYGHGISNRLTGGPSTTSCLGNQEQMGEGWSDWLALVLTTDPADTATTARGIGTYVRFEPPTGGGIRPTPYTTDMSINPTTYGDIPGLAVPHGVGYAWATMLWEVYWNLVDVYGYNPDVYGDWTTGGNNLAIQLVMDGMKLQTCRPGFVDGRDAILMADQVLTGGANQCHIWNGFAKRGLGYSADQGSNNSSTDGTEAFDLPLGCHFEGFFGPINNPPDVNTVRAGSTVPVLFGLGGDQGLDVLAGGFPASQEVDCETGAVTGALLSTRAPGNSGLTYDADTDRYTYPWQTSRSWAGTCRQFVVDFGDGIDYAAMFEFTP